MCVYVCACAHTRVHMPMHARGMINRVRGDKRQG